MWRLCIAVIVPLVLVGCSTAPRTESELIAILDDTSCDTGGETPVRLDDRLRGSNVSFFLTEVSELVAAEVARVSDPQDLVVVEGLGASAEHVGGRLLPGVANDRVTIREDRFEALELAAPFGGRVVVAVRSFSDVPLSGNLLGWVDSEGNVHFLGRCGNQHFNDPLSSFEEAIAWSGTQEALLLELVARGELFELLLETSSDL